VQQYEGQGGRIHDVIMRVGSVDVVGHVKVTRLPGLLRACRLLLLTGMTHG
jgi:hypothetical protein